MCFSLLLSCLSFSLFPPCASSYKLVVAVTESAIRVHRPITERSSYSTYSSLPQRRQSSHRQQFPRLAYFRLLFVVSFSFFFFIFLSVVLSWATFLQSIRLCYIADAAVTLALSLPLVLVNRLCSTILSVILSFLLTTAKSGVLCRQVSLF